MESSEDDVASLFSFDSSSEDEGFAFNDILDINEGILEGGKTRTLDEFGVVPVNTAEVCETDSGNKGVSSAYTSTTMLSDEMLEKMSIQDFNKQLRRLPADLRQKFRKRRRVLKNRKYSRKFRQKGSECKNNVAAENRALEFEIFRAKEELRKVTKERDEFKQKYARLKRTVAVSF